MNIVPQSAEAIARSLSTLRWQNRIAAVVLGAFATFFVVMIVVAVIGVSLPPLSVVICLGAVAGLALDQRHWTRAISRLRKSYIRLDGAHLEVQGVAAGATTHVRFRTTDILSIEIGRKRNSIAGTLPIVRAIDSLALVIREKSGASIAFEWAAVVFPREDLAQLASIVRPRLQK